MKERENISVLVQKYLENKCTRVELENFLQIISERKYKEQIELILFEYWKAKPSFQVQIDKEELDELQKSINRKIRYGSNDEKPGVLRRLSYYMNKAVAVLFIPLLIGTALLCRKTTYLSSPDSMISMETPARSKVKTILPDGTEVWQNNGTILRYPANFSGNNRKVELIGEAYFHVSSDKKHPFYVETAKGIIKVTGTRFNVCAFPEDESSSIVLEEGKIAFQSNGSGPLINLEPETKITINNKTGQIVKQYTDIDKYTSWIEGKLIFRDDPLTLVIGKLRRWYDADITISDPSGKLSQLPLTMTVQNELLPQVLENIAQAIHAKLEMKKDPSSNTQNQYILSGDYN